MLSQGAKAAKEGDNFELLVEELLVSKNLDYQRQFKYEGPVYTSGAKNKLDFLVGDTAIECKYQAVGGTADMKGFAELWFATKHSWRNYILVLGGPHWTTKERGKKLYKELTDFCNLLNNIYEDKFIQVCYYDDLEEILDATIIEMDGRQT